MSAVALAAKRFLRRTGWVGILGLALLLGSPVFYAATVLPMRKQVEALKKDQRQMRRNILQTGRRLTPAPTGEMQLKVFYRLFPSVGHSDEWLAKIYALAERQHIVLESGEYKLGEEDAGEILRYQITLPLKGSHVQIRRFLSDLLTEISALSLDDVSFKRETIDLPTVNARVKLTLFLGKPA
ncbi:MAG: hypothetical protein ACYC05_06045 [Sulfuricella sp.]